MSPNCLLADTLVTGRLGFNDIRDAGAEALSEVLKDNVTLTSLE